MLTEADMMRKVFCTDEVAHEFYKRYGKCMGGGFFCNKAGLRQCKHYKRLDRKRDHRSETRTNCDAKLSILWDEVSKLWSVRKVILDHNHDLTPMRMVHMINSFRDMNCSAKAQINGMQGHGVPTSKILGYIAGQAGGYSLMGFTKKDAYNYIEKTKREKIVDGDANDASVIEYRLHDSFWAKETYDKRKMWANAYLKDKLCAGHSVLELVQNVEFMVREYQNNELEAHFKSIHDNPVIVTCLDPLERFAANVYPQELFLDVRREIEGVRAVIFVAKVRRSTTMVYTVEDYGIPGRPLTLLYDRVVNRVQCPCQFWLRKGYPCRHIFFVLKHEHARKIPSRLVLKRWCKDAKSLDNYGKRRADECNEREFLLCQGALHSASQ
ncbi:hypothetical protein Ahy_A01g003297 [Arachis hypogaea]|uniref:SWIM-type domain-containing protein n=1 Tax=Arachis hypogaea TaxID=3818 RepID=A0A445ESL5_ARAHY|nr:hypothetical protein Ahy_A01g003297 [Arachis hypogaea]